MLKSMMQPPQSKLSSAEFFVFVLMPVFLIGYGSRACGRRTFPNAGVDVGDLQDGKMIRGFQLHLFCPLERARGEKQICNKMEVDTRSRGAVLGQWFHPDTGNIKQLRRCSRS